MIGINNEAFCRLHRSWNVWKRKKTKFTKHLEAFAISYVYLRTNRSLKVSNVYRYLQNLYVDAEGVVSFSSCMIWLVAL